MSETYNGYQTLAWISWRTQEAVTMFAGSSAAALWKQAKAGKFPKELGKPVVTPTVAEIELQEAIRKNQVKVLPSSTSA